MDFWGIPYLSGDDVTLFKGIHILVLLALHYPLLCYIDTGDDGLVDSSCLLCTLSDLPMVS